ncbi:hypothetical protein ACFCP7_27015 [Paenibacillus elgii]
MEKQMKTEAIEGHKVEILRREDGREELWIDGHRRKFFVTEKGYILNDDAFSPPQKTLIKAVENYLRKYSNSK